ncbi:hypothetical protein STVIR_8052 [Streptomyces viridochromogenes Tue57]|uniref:Uncharacterized protein n=1 Tax=Streptomyces viridochromogenes Tue57 TaxID=1160705 RepID=L8P6P7_STRVR|nr:hypothetical protein [Streptomyces viridochromogenes]ELS50982.1 hypothetical protein STVIR_8052 [Streptomyces viridochromogenes Tue57]
MSSTEKNAGKTGGVARRGFLRGAALAGAGLAAGGAAAPSAVSGTGPVPVARFHGAHQQSVLAAPRRVTAFTSFDVTAGSRAELTDLLRTLTDRAS